jgi:hypothetical protein
MFQAWRVQLRAAEQAYRGGLLDEAGRMLRRDNLKDFRPGQNLSVKVADGLARRGAQRLAVGDTSAGWRDLESASALASELESLADLRRRLVDHAVEEAERLVEGDDPIGAAARLSRLQRRNVDSSRVRLLAQVVHRIERAKECCQRGEFDRAIAELTAAANLRPGWAAVDTRLADCKLKKDEFRTLGDRLHAGLTASDWREVLTVADLLLALAPKNEAVREARKRAWQALAGAAPADRVTQPAINGHAAINGVARARRPVAAREAVKVDVVSSQRTEHAGSRFLLWIDSVGGYLVCLGDEVVLGQPVDGGPADVPILADLSRRHATIRREQEGYTILATSPHRIGVNGRAITSAGALTDGCVIELGGSVRIRFRQPHPLSQTARLEFLSHHRTRPGADAVLLFASTCVLGPKRASHVVCRNWNDEVLLSRQGDGLQCRASGRFEIDGVPQDNEGLLTFRSQVSGEDFGFRLEPA